MSKKTQRETNLEKEQQRAAAAAAQARIDFFQREKERRFNQFMLRRPMPTHFHPISHFLMTLDRYENVRYTNDTLKMFDDYALYGAVIADKLLVTDYSHYADPAKHHRHNQPWRYGSANGEQHLVVMVSESNTNKVPRRTPVQIMPWDTAKLAELRANFETQTKKEREGRFAPLYAAGVLNGVRLNIDAYFAAMRQIAANDIAEKMAEEAAKRAAEVPDQPTEEPLNLVDAYTRPEPEGEVEMPADELAKRIGRGRLQSDMEFISDIQAEELKRVDDHIEKLGEVNAAFGEPNPKLQQVETRQRELPKKVDLSENLPPVEDQGDLGSSSSFAIAGGLAMPK